MSAAETAVSDDEAAALFSDLATSSGVVLAISGGPDSTALLVLAARWRRRLESGPTLTAVTIDHGLRPGSAQEAAGVKRLARELGVMHRTVRWVGDKPATGVQEAARAARYQLLVRAARKARAPHILTAHTRDDQAETVLYRFLRGSGVGGLSGMARTIALDAETGAPVGLDTTPQVLLTRPFLGVAKARLIATLDSAGIEYADDPSNTDPRYARTRLRRILAELTTEGLTPERLTLLAERARRAEDALEWAVDQVSPGVTVPSVEGIRFDAAHFAALPPAIALRLTRRAIAQVGDEGPVELAKLEALMDSLRAAVGATGATFRRTLAGAAIAVRPGAIEIVRAPARRRRARSGTKGCSATPRAPGPGPRGLGRH